jgi:hypothetical protein
MKPIRDGSQGRAPRIEPDPVPEGAPKILGTVKRHPHLLEPMLRFSAALAAGAPWNCGSLFEWTHHTRYGLDAGLTGVEIERLAGGSPDVGWEAADAALIRAADELHADQDVSDETWSRLARDWDEGQLVEIPFVVGQYTLLSMVAKATGVPVDVASDDD